MGTKKALFVGDGIRSLRAAGLYALVGALISVLVLVVAHKPVRSWTQAMPPVSQRMVPPEDSSDARALRAQRSLVSVVLPYRGPQIPLNQPKTGSCSNGTYVNPSTACEW